MRKKKRKKSRKKVEWADIGAYKSKAQAQKAAKQHTGVKGFGLYKYRSRSRVVKGDHGWIVQRRISDK